MCVCVSVLVSDRVKNIENEENPIEKSTIEKVCFLSSDTCDWQTFFPQFKWIKLKVEKTREKTSDLMCLIHKSKIEWHFVRFHFELSSVVVVFCAVFNRCLQ